MPETTENARGPIFVNDGFAIHYGDEHGALCGTGFNRKGGTPRVRRTDGAAITCMRCRQAMPREGREG